MLGIGAYNANDIEPTRTRHIYKYIIHFTFIHDHLGNTIPGLRYLVAQTVFTSVHLFWTNVWVFVPVSDPCYDSVDI